MSATARPAARRALVGAASTSASASPSSQRVVVSSKRWLHPYTPSPAATMLPTAAHTPHARATVPSATARPTSISPSTSASSSSSSSSSSAEPAFAELGRHFYLNRVLESYASRPATRMTLRQLVFFGRTLGRDRDKILKSANYVREELAVRIAHRIRDLQALPFVVMTNKHLEEVYNKYWTAFETFRKMPVIHTMEDNERFCSTLRRLLQDHLTIIPSLTIGIVESSHHLQPRQLDKFMERMLRSRISRRVLAEQHIALSEALDDPFHFFNDVSPSTTSNASPSPGDHVGIIYTNLCVSSVVQKGVSLLRAMFARELGIAADDEWIPHVTIDGDLEARFAYIPEHLEYIVFELLKNAMSAVMRRPMEQRDKIPIRVTIVEGPPDEDLIIRISDCGGGLPDLVSRLQAPALAVPVPKASPASNPTLHGGGATRDPLGRAFDLDETPPASSSSVPPYPTSQQREPRRSSRDASHRISTSSDALIDVVTSFSNVRRRLELEEALARRQRRHEMLADRGAAPSAAAGGGAASRPAAAAAGNDGGASADGASASTASAAPASSSASPPLSSSSSSSSSSAAGPSVVQTGLSSRDRLEALRRVRTFKGTVAEQLGRGGKHGPGGSGARDDDGVAPTQSRAREAPPTSTRPPTSSPSPSRGAPAWVPRGDDGTPAHVTRPETGLGLPMTKVYTDFFGGSLSMKNVSGGGLDIYVRLPKLGLHKEAIEDIVL